MLLLQASDGTTTMAQQLPKALQQLVQDKVSCDRVPDAYRVIAVAQKQQLQQQQAVVKAQRQQLKRQQTVVKAQQQQLEQQEQLQGDNVQLRQEVGDLQARLVAALEQLGSQEGPRPLLAISTPSAPVSMPCLFWQLVDPCVGWAWGVPPLCARCASIAAECWSCCCVETCL